MAYEILSPLTQVAFELTDSSGTKLFICPLLIVSFRVLRGLSRHPYLYYTGKGSAARRKIWVEMIPAGADLSLYGMFKDDALLGITALENFQNTLRAFPADDEVLDFTSSKYFTIKVDKLLFKRCLVTNLNFQKDPQTQVWTCSVAYACGRVERST